MRKLTAALCTILLLLLWMYSAPAQLLEVPGQPDGAPSRDVRPDPPPAEPEAEVPPPADTLELPPSVAAPVELDLREPGIIGPPGTLPDELKAAEVAYEPDGTLVLMGVTLTVASLIKNGGPAIVSAGYGRLSMQTQQLELSGGVRIAVENAPGGLPLALDAQAANWDGKAKSLSVQGLAVLVPLRALLGDKLDPNVEAKFAAHTRIGRPDFVYFNAGEVEVRQVGKERAVVLRDVQISPSARPGGDLYITAREATLGAGSSVRLNGIALWVEGIKLLTLPGYTIGGGGHRGGGVLSFDPPKISLTDGGVKARLPVHVDAGPLHVESRLAYSPEYDFAAHGFAYVDVWDGGKLGVQHGDIETSDFARNTYLRGDDYVLTARQRNAWGPWRLALDVESGDVGWKSIENGTLIVGGREERMLTSADIELTAEPLGGDWYFTGGVSGKRIDYTHTQYDVLGARAGVIWQQGGFNNFALYRENSVDGTAALPFDAVRRRELSFQARTSLIPRVNHIVRGVYDFDRDRYDRLELGTLLQRRGYEVGFYWDFARERAGLELGIATP